MREAAAHASGTLAVASYVATQDKKAAAEQNRAIQAANQSKTDQAIATAAAAYRAQVFQFFWCEPCFSSSFQDVASLEPIIRFKILHPLLSTLSRPVKAGTVLKWTSPIFSLRSQH